MSDKPRTPSENGTFALTHALLWNMPIEHRNLINIKFSHGPNAFPPHNDSLLIVLFKVSLFFLEHLKQYKILQVKNAAAIRAYIICELATQFNYFYCLLIPYNGIVSSTKSSTFTQSTHASESESSLRTSGCNKQFFSKLHYRLITLARWCHIDFNGLRRTGIYCRNEKMYFECWTSLFLLWCFWLLVGASFMMGGPIMWTIVEN